nr:reverse transcriptase domain-containing protein [Tanacetum cinerariifolium]
MHLAVHNIQQREGESTQAFITRYTDDTIQILGLHKEQRILGFVHGLRTRSLVEHLSTDLSSTYKGLMEKSYTWVEAREAARSFEPPPKMFGSKRSRDMSKYCHFHEDYRHNNNDCRNLKTHIQEAVNSRQFSYLVKGIKNERTKSSDTPRGESKKDKGTTPAEAPILMVSREAHIAKSLTHKQGMSQRLLSTTRDRLENRVLVSFEVLPRRLQGLPSNPNSRRRRRQNNLLRMRRILLLQEDVVWSQKCRGNIPKVSGQGPFLGHLITKKGIKANPLKVKAVTDLDQPRTLKDIQSLNGKLAALIWEVAKAIQDCKKCKEQFTIRKAGTSRAIAAGSTRPFSHWGIHILGPLPMAPGAQKKRNISKKECSHTREAANSKPTGMGGNLAKKLWIHRTLLRNSQKEIPFSLTYGSEVVIPIIRTTYDRGRVQKATKGKESKEVASIEKAYY